MTLLIPIGVIYLNKKILLDETREERRRGRKGEGRVEEKGEERRTVRRGEEGGEEKGE